MSWLYALLHTYYTRGGQRHMAMGRGGTRSRAWFMHMHTWSVIWFVDWPRIPAREGRRGAAKWRCSKEVAAFSLTGGGKAAVQYINFYGLIRPRDFSRPRFTHSWSIIRDLTGMHIIYITIMHTWYPDIYA